MAPIGGAFEGTNPAYLQPAGDCSNQHLHLVALAGRDGECLGLSGVT